MSEYVYGTRQASEYAGIAPRTLKLWVQQGKIKPTKEVEDMSKLGWNKFKKTDLDKLT